MAAVEVTITGMLYDKTARTTQNVVLVGEASLTGLGVGGGPVIPPGGGGGEGIWGPTDPRPGQLPMPGGRPPGFWGGAPLPVPTPPIYLPPVNPGDPPLVIWGPNDPRPTPPIHLPGPPPDVSPAPPDVAVKPPPAAGGWAYVGAPGWGWGYFPGEKSGGPK